MATRPTETRPTDPAETVLGRDRSAGEDHGATTSENRQCQRPWPKCRLGVYRARDGSDGAPVGLDLDGPHVALVVGKRGSGKSHTLGVLAEGLLDATGVVPVVVDPMAALGGLAALGANVVEAPRIRADTLPPAAWPALLGLEGTDPVGSLVWMAAAESTTLAGMRDHVAGAGVTASVRRGAANHLGLASSWGVFAADGLTPGDLLADDGVVLDLSGLAPAPANAVVRAVARGLYQHLVDGGSSGPSGQATAADGPATPDPLPWLLIDEAHAFFDGVAAPALRTVLTRGRAPGVSLVAATQRPGALPSVAISQADLVVAHRLTAEADVAALEAATPTYLHGRLRERLPAERGCAVVLDDATEAVHGIRVRARRSPHGGASPSVTDRARSTPASGPQT